MGERLGLIEGTITSRIRNNSIPQNNTSGVVGVSFNAARKRWSAFLQFQGQVHFLGSFVNKDAATEARKQAENKYFGEFLDNLKRNKAQKK